MQKYEDWLEENYPYECEFGESKLREAYEAGYKQRDEEINEHYRKVMNNEDSTENIDNSTSVGDRDYSC